MILRRAFVHIVVGGLVAVAAGCDTGEPDSSDGDPLAELRAAAVMTVSVPTHLTMTVPQVEVLGDVDPSAETLALTISTLGNGDASKQLVRVLGDDAYLMLGKTYLPTIDPTKYIQFPADTFATASVVHLADPFDPAGVKGLSAAFVDARRTGDGSYAGTLDLTKAPAGTSRGLLPATEEQLRGAEDSIKDIPYTATADSQGYLTSMTVEMPAYGAVPAYASKITFTELGEPVQVSRPGAAELTEVPDAVRRLLAG
jgi:hypothetical protein